MLLGLAWLLAGLSAAPQAFVWGTAEVEPGWVQCMTIWDMKRLARIKELELSDGSNEDFEKAYSIRHSHSITCGP